MTIRFFSARESYFLWVALHFLALKPEQKSKRAFELFHWLGYLRQHFHLEPAACVLEFVQEHLTLPRDWEDHAEFTALELHNQVETLNILLTGVRQRLKHISWQKLQHQPDLEQWSSEALALLEWPTEKLKGSLVSEPDGQTPLFEYCLRFLALSPAQKKQYLPYRFEGTVHLDNMNPLELDDPFELMTLYLLDHGAFPDFYEDDPAFTALIVKDQEAEVIERLMWMDRRLNEIEGPELKTDVNLSVWAQECLALLEWPDGFPEEASIEVLSNYTYGGFREVALPELDVED